MKYASGWRAAAQALVLTLLLSFFAAWLYAQPPWLALYNSDLVHPFLLAEDLLADPRQLFSWHHSPALYVFPDWLLSAALVSLPWPHVWVPLAYVGVMMALYSLAGGLACAAIGRCSALTAAWLMALLLMLAGVLVLPFSAAPLGPGLYHQLGTAYVHSGALLATVAAIALWLWAQPQDGGALRGADARRRAAALVGLTLLGFAATFSDPLFIPWLALPLAITAGWHGLAARTPAPLLRALPVLLAVAAGYLLQAELNAQRGMVATRSAGSFEQSLAFVRSALPQLIERRDWPLLVFGLLAALLGARALVVLGTSWRRRALPPSAQLELLLAGGCAGALMAPIATGMLVDWGTTRYLLALGLLPLLWVLCWLTRGGPPAPLRRGLPLAACVALPALAMPAWSGMQRLAAAGPLQQCLQAQGVAAGFGDYWAAKSLLFASGRRIHVVQLAGVDRYRWNFNERWFTRRADDDTPLRPNFILPRNLDAALLRRQFGEPDRIVQCADQALWLYDRPLALPWAGAE